MGAGLAFLVGEITVKAPAFGFFFTNSSFFAGNSFFTKDSLLGMGDLDLDLDFDFVVIFLKAGLLLAVFFC